MAVRMNRNKIITSLRDYWKGLITAAGGTWTYLEAMNANAVLYCNKDPRNLKVIEYEEEVWLGPFIDPVSAATVAREDHDFQITCIVVVKGRRGVVDFTRAINIAEDLEQWLLQNRDIPNAGAITAFADGGGGTVTVTSAGHALSNGDVVVISNTTSYNGTFTISGVTTDTFKITDTWVADDATGNYRSTSAYMGVIRGDIDFDFDYDFNHDKSSLVFVMFMIPVSRITYAT